MIHVRTNIQRPTEDIIKAFYSISSATIHEASGRKGYIDYMIKPIAKGMRICGPAFTVQCAAGDNIMLHKALERAKAGDILVVSVGGAFDYGYFGDLMATSAIARKIGGLCIEGCIRDSKEIIDSGFPVFARGFCIRGTGKGALGVINYPTVFGGQMINPGDLIIGDDDGLVCVHREDCEAVLQKARQRIEKEKIKAEDLAKGISSVEYNNFGPLFEAAGLVEE
ncbi:MAG: 4-carboxy-4-hydroxy-2-oxoadipate aldolase/oxaloacetate decarboxylase [Acetivibrionales bacterium]|jgi:4-hydroxy-4-methyl-2-oxoglutarate aldolase